MAVFAISKPVLKASSQDRKWLSQPRCFRFGNVHVFSGETMSLTLTDVKRIAHLARLELPDHEAEPTLARLNDFFGLVEQMQAVDTAGIEPLAHPIEQIEEVALRLRDDAVSERVDRQEFQKSAPAVQDGLYLVPKVIE
jgi:aspartyl-tRNA(Asn)/glutamyl-tRNA(Gln) amidotransferase subunit C